MNSPKNKTSGGVKKGFLFSFILTVGIGAFQFGRNFYIKLKGYSIGVFNPL